MLRCYASIQTCYIEVVSKVMLMEELKDIIGGLEQRISAYKAKLQDLQKRKEKLEDEIITIKKYLELAETLYRVELDKAKISPTAPASNVFSFPDKEKTSKTPIVGIAETTEKAKDLLFGKSKYAGLSVPQAAFLLLKDHGKPMHAKEILQKLIEGASGFVEKPRLPLFQSLSTATNGLRKWRQTLLILLEKRL